MWSVGVLKGRWMVGCKEKGWGGAAVGVAGGPKFPLTHKGRAFPRWGYVH